MTSDKRTMMYMEVSGKEVYLSPDWWTMSREDGKLPNGNDMNGRWVLRNGTGELVDFDHIRNDIAERNALTLLDERFLPY